MPPKGKPQTKGAKQIEAENKDTLKFYLYIIGGVNTVFFAAQVLLFIDTFTSFYIVLSVFALLTHLGCYKFMSSMAGKGVDVNMESGLAEHAKDILLLTAIVQGLALISNYFWLLWLLGPGRALYLLWVHILGPWFFAEAPPEMDEKKQKKMERRMKRH